VVKGIVESGRRIAAAIVRRAGTGIVPKTPIEVDLAVQSAMGIEGVSVLDAPLHSRRARKNNEFT
jgi:hypothetical protein